MAIFAISFEIDYDSAERYQRCYDQLNDAIKAQTTSTYWKDTTSFYLIESDKSSVGLADAIVDATPDFKATQDLLVVINISVTKGHAVRGTLRDKDFNALIGRRT